MFGDCHFLLVGFNHLSSFLYIDWWKLDKFPLVDSVISSRWVNHHIENHPCNHHYWNHISHLLTFPTWNVISSSFTCRYGSELINFFFSIAGCFWHFPAFLLTNPPPLHTNKNSTIVQLLGSNSYNKKSSCEVVITNAGGMPLRPHPQAVSAFKDFLFVSSRCLVRGVHQR